jgi:hypothetical protein
MAFLSKQLQQALIGGAIRETSYIEFCQAVRRS